MCAGLSTLDNLVANGVLNFDADAYVRGDRPRYAGNPFGSQELPFDQPICPSMYPYASYGGYAPIMPPQPNADAFINRYEHSNANSAKEVLITGGLIGLGIYALHKVNKLGGFFKEKLSNIGKSKTKTETSAASKPAGNNGATPPKGTEPPKDAPKLKWYGWKNIKKYGGWALGGVVVIGALALLRSMFRKKPQQLSPEQMQMMSQQLEQAQAQPTDPAAAQQQAAQVSVPTAQVAQQAPEPQPAPVVQVAQQTPENPPAPEIQPVPPVQA